MIFVQSEAAVERRRFPLYLVDATDGITPETGEGGGQPQISKAGNAFTNTTATLAHVGNGSYFVELTPTELNLLGNIVVRYKSANTAEFNAVADVLAFNVHSATVSVPEIGTLTQAASAGDPNTTNTIVQMLKQTINTLEGTAGIPVWPAGANPGNGVSIAEGLRQTNINAGGTMTGINDILGVLGFLNDAAADGDPTTTDTVMAYVKQIINTLVGTAGIPTWPAAAAPASGINLVEVIRRMYLDIAANAFAISTVQADTDNIQTRLPAALVSGRMDSAVGAMANDVLTAAALDPAAANEIGAATWEVPSYLHTTEGTTGAALVDAAAGGGATPPTAAEVADAVWDEPASAHVAPGSTGDALADAATGGDPWATVVPGAYGAGTAGNLLGNRLDAAVSTRATPAQVNAEIVDALSVDLYPEPGQQAPPMSASLATKINYVFKFLRNRITSSGTEIRVYNDAGTVVDHKAPHVDAAGVYDRGEFVSGP